MDNLATRGKALMWVAKYRWSLRSPIAILLAGVLVCAGTLAYAAVNIRDLTQSQRARDQAFRTLKASTTEYTFEYVVIQVSPGSLPGIQVPVPVSHIRFKSTIFFAFNKADIEPVADKAILDLARTVMADKSARSLLIVGHTDSIGSDEYNSALSLSRAVAVAARL
jgi:outer membrane protein OmpA-like peptidoglycan-associated protein